VPVPAAAVVPLRERAPGAVEVLLLRRHRRASFMADTFVFPGGRLDPEDGCAEVAAIRELFEEAGILVSLPRLAPARCAAGRARLLAAETTFAALLAAEGVGLDRGRLVPWARWITPSLQPQRFDAQFFLAAVAPTDEGSCDAGETVARLWVSPPDALARCAAGTLALPPPQIVTLMELTAHAAGGLSAIRAAAAERPHPPPAVQPRVAEVGGALTLLLPWDPEYERLGAGEGLELGPAARPAGAPLRLTLVDERWRPG
jgi:8-oxo-dGTP pyrophosphatase MutT (NUDIX family)